MLFLAKFDPLPPVTLCHTSWDPHKVRHTSRTPPIFSWPSTKNPDKSPLYKFSLNCSRGFLSGEFCQGVFCLKGFVRGGFCPFPLLSEYINYNRKVNITLNFMFHTYDKKMYKRDVTCFWPPLSQTVTPSWTPSHPRAWRTLWTAPYAEAKKIKSLTLHTHPLKFNGTT